MQAKDKKSSRRNCVYIIAGKDTSLLDAECDKLLDELVEQSDRAMGLLNAEADKISVVEVMDELRTLPFLSKQRVVLLRNADKFVKEYREQLEKYFDAPSPTGILILTMNSLDSRTRLAKKLPEVGKLLSIIQPTGKQLPSRLKQYAGESFSKVLDNDSAQLLVELVGEDLARLYTEIDKLAVYVGDKKKITARDVHSLVGHNRLYNTFNVIDSVISRDAAKAVDELRRLFDQDRSAQYTFVGAFAYHLRRMFSAKVMLDKGAGEDAVSKRLRIWHSKYAFFSQVRKATLPQIGSLIEQLAQTDYEIKTGRTTPKTAAEQLVMKLATS